MTGSVARLEFLTANFFELQEIQFDTLPLIMSKIGGIYALLVPIIAVVLFDRRAFIKNLVRKIKQIPGWEDKTYKEVEYEVSTKLSFVELFKLHLEVKKSNLRFEDVT